MLVMEYVPGGTLEKYLEEHGDELSTIDRLKVCLQVCNAMVHIHKIKLIHRDIAARNVLLNWLEVDKKRVLNCKVRMLHFERRVPWVSACYMNCAIFPFSLVAVAGSLFRCCVQSFPIFPLFPCSLWCSFPFTILLIACCLFADLSLSLFRLFFL